MSLTFRKSAHTGSMPTQIGLLNKLTWLSVDDNQIEGQHLISLSYLNSQEVKWCEANVARVRDASEIPLFKSSSFWISGEIPTQIGSLTSLQSFNAFDNRFEGQCRLKSLATLFPTPKSH